MEMVLCMLLTLVMIKDGGMGGGERGGHYEVGGGDNRLGTYCFAEVKG